MDAAAPSPEANQDIPDDGAPSWWYAEEASAVSPARDALDRDLHDHLVHTLNDPDRELPRLPAVAQRALLMLNDREVNFQRLARVIEQDPAVSAEVLRVANSVAYRGIREVTRLDLAFGRLGHRTLQSMIMAMTVKGLAIAPGGAVRTLGEELWRRSLASGVVLGRMARHFRLDENEAFLTGLLHDIGLLALLRAVHDYQKTHGRGVSRAMFERLAEEWHEHLGLRVADAWNLPAPLPDLIGAHHAHPADDDPYRTQRLLIQFSDCVCGALGFGPYQRMDWRRTQCVSGLGLLENAEARAGLEDLPGIIQARIAAFTDGQRVGAA